MYPAKFESLVESLRKFPGVGLKTAERYAFEILEWKDDEINNFIQVLQNIKEIQKCEVCGNISESTKCPICENKDRDQNIICVVQHSKDVIAMEKTNQYHGVYHVLNGVISTSKGIMPDDINIQTLVDRIDENTKEIILATNPTVEGETTAMYISKLLENKNIKVTRIAHGLPMGGHLDYVDEMTLIKALEGRKSM